MTKSSNNISKSIGFIIGVPLLLLIGSLFLMEPVEKPVILAEANKYYNNLPETYQALADSSINKRLSEDYELTKADSFEVRLNESNFERQLIILKALPNSEELQNDFEIEIIPRSENGGSKPIKLTLTNNAIIYKYRNQEHAVFKALLPYIDISTIKVTQKPRFPQTEPWSITIQSDFEQPEFKRPALVEEGKTRPVHPLRPLLNRMLEINDIDHDFIGYSMQGAEILEVYKDDFLDSNNQPLTVLKVSKPDAFWNALENPNVSIDKLVEFNGPNISKVKEILGKYQSGELDFKSVFNQDKWINYLGISKLFTNSCSMEPMLLFLNDNTKKLEPLFSNYKCIGESYGYIPKSPIKDAEFIRSYVEGLNQFSQMDFSDELNNNESVTNLNRWINFHHPEKIFNLDYVSINQLKVKKYLKQSTVLKAELISIDKDRLEFTVKNVSYLPIRVTGLNHKGKKQVLELNPQIEIASGAKDTIIMDLPRSFENLFVSKKKKTTGFLLYKHIYDLNVTFRTLGEDKTQTASIIPYQEKESVAEDLFRPSLENLKHPDLIINENQKSLSFKKDSVVINKPLILPSGYNFKPRPGTVIDIKNGGKIISYASFEMIGNKNQPIQILSSDGMGQGILVLGAKEKSTLRHVRIDGLTHPKHGDWSVTGAVTFYESPVSLSYVSISNNSCEDALNIVRTNFTMVQSTISNTQSDAFDGDFVTGTISDSRFDNLGNDAIDISGSDLTIKNVVVSNAGDKGLSAGEDSQMKVTDVEISNSEIGVAGKDLSIVDIKRITIKDTKLGFTAFKKKPEFGPSSITVINHVLENLEMNYLIESSSSLIVNGEKIETTQNVKDRMYGVEFGVSSAETRNAQ